MYIHCLRAMNTHASTHGTLIHQRATTKSPLASIDDWLHSSDATSSLCPAVRLICAQTVEDRVCQHQRACMRMQQFDTKGAEEARAW